MKSTTSKGTQRQLGWREAVAAVGPERGPGFGGHLLQEVLRCNALGTTPLAWVALALVEADRLKPIGAPIQQTPDSQCI
jgi:hypothetical protein